MQLGKQIRMERIFNRDSRRTIIVPLDHGVTVGPVAGIESMRETVSRVAQGGANAVLMHKGLVSAGHRGQGRDLGLIVHLSASTTHSPSPNFKALVGTVEDAIRLGADAVSLHVNLGDDREKEMLSDLGKITSSAKDWGMPVLAMVYGRGPGMREYDPKVVAHCARLGEELGADLVKVNYTGDQESFSRVVNSCSIPVVIAGGEKMNTRKELLKVVSDSLAAGGAGLSIGRNVFQDEDPVDLLQKLDEIVHQEKDWQDLVDVKRVQVA